MWRLRKRTGTKLSLPTGETVRVFIDAAEDAATIVLSKSPVARTERVEGLGLIDLDAEGNVVAVEVLGLRKQLETRREGEQEGNEETDLVEELRVSASRVVDEARQSVHA